MNALYMSCTTSLYIAESIIDGSIKDLPKSPCRGSPGARTWPHTWNPDNHARFMIRGGCFCIVTCSIYNSYQVASFAVSLSFFVVLWSQTVNQVLQQVLDGTQFEDGASYNVFVKAGPHASRHTSSNKWISILISIWLLFHGISSGDKEEWIGQTSLFEALFCLKGCPCGSRGPSSGWTSLTFRFSSFHEVPNPM